MKNVFLGTLMAVLLTGAISASAQDLTNKNWKVYNLNVNEAKLWDINHTAAKDAYNAGFTFNQESTGWYTAYMTTNFGFLNGKSSISYTASWTPTGMYTNRRSTAGDARFRIFFQSAEGNASMNDYWWSTGDNSCDLNVQQNCSINVSLTDPTQWSNLCGKSAADTNSYPNENCGTGAAFTSASPAAGFQKALRNAKAGGLSFGGGSFYANGVVVSDLFTDLASFQLTSYRIN